MYDLPLQQIARGTLVFDRLGRPLGYVDYIQTPDVRHAQSVPETSLQPENRQRDWDFGEDILELAFQGDDQFDEGLTAQMESFGYFHVVTPEGNGLFVFGDEIDHEEGGALFLNVEDHEVLRHSAHTTQ